MAILQITVITKNEKGVPKMIGGIEEIKQLFSKGYDHFAGTFKIDGENVKITFRLDRRNDEL
jgi:hypothetical protein